MVFVFSQVVGLAVVNEYLGPVDVETGELTWDKLPFETERPEVEESSSYAYIFVAIIIGTLLALLLIKFRKVRLWKLWFFISVWLTLTIAFAAFISDLVALFLALVLALYKILKPNVYVHNFTEIFIYGGLAAIFVPIMNLFAAFMLLGIISIYDMIAVWKIKHMVTLATFQSETKLFAGLFIPYERGKKAKAEKTVRTKKTKTKIVKVKNAILGGGDIGFPLIFAGVVMKSVGFLKALIIPAFVTIALFLLLTKSKEDRFYPAMPFLSAGCLVGWVVVYLL